MHTPELCKCAVPVCGDLRIDSNNLFHFLSSKTGRMTSLLVIWRGVASRGKKKDSMNRMDCGFWLGTYIAETT